MQPLHEVYPKKPTERLLLGYTSSASATCRIIYTFPAVFFTFMPISVAIIEDQPVVLAHFSAIIQADPGLSLVATASNGEEGRELIRNVSADIYLVDLGLPDFSGLLLLPEIMRRRPAANA